MENHRKVIIIGSGPAGWTAAIYAARAGLNPLVITGSSVGGQMTITGDVENYPGFPHPVTGPDLMNDMEAQAVSCGAEVEYDVINDVDFSSRPFKLVGEIGDWTADAVIIATGATARWLGVEGESQYHGNGVSACATCDGPFFKGKTVAVVGGGNTAAEEAIHLAGLCEKVYLIHRRSELKAEKILCERISQLDNVEFIWNSTLESIHGNQTVTHVKIASIDSPNDNMELSVNGVFIAIGHDPATAFIRDKISIDTNGYIIVKPGRTSTNVDGVFAAGDVADPHYRQAVTSAAMGCMAALDAERWLRSLC